MTREKKSWLEQQLEDPEFRLGFDQEWVAEEFRRQVLEAIESEGTTQAELARRLGRSRAFVSQSLGRGRNLTIRTMVEMCSALGHKLEIGVRKPLHRDDVLTVIFDCGRMETWAWQSSEPQAKVEFSTAFEWPASSVDVHSLDVGGLHVFSGSRQVERPHDDWIPLPSQQEKVVH